MVDGARMKSRQQSCCTKLTTAQLTELVTIIAEDHGSMLSRPEFNDVVLMLCEDIAGLELLTHTERNQLLKKMWSRCHVPTTIFNVYNANVLIVIPHWIINGPVPVLDPLCLLRCYLCGTPKKNIFDVQFSKTVMWVLIRSIRAAFIRRPHLPSRRRHHTHRHLADTAEHQAERASRLSEALPHTGCDKCEV